MNRIIILALSLFFITLDISAQHGDSNDKAQEIIDQYLEVIGGESNWKRVESYKIEAVLAMQGMEFPMTLIQARPDKQRIESRIMGKTMVQAYDGSTGWTINPFEMSSEPRPMNEQELSEFRNQTFENEFIDYQRKGTKITYQGTENIEGINCHKLLLRFANGMEKFVFISSDDFVPIMERTFVQEGPTKGQAVETFYSNYAEVDGLFMAHEVTVKSQDQTISAIRIDKIRYNINVTDAMFAFPK